MSLLDDVSIVVTPNGYKAGELYAVVPVPTEGAEEITNGAFATNLDSWSTSSWWVWNSLGAYHPSTSSHKPLYQQCCVIGKTYLITFELNCVGSSLAKFSLGSSTGSTTQVIDTSLPSGSYSYYVTAAAEYIVFNRQNTAEFYVDNVSVKEALTVSADMDVTRATAATRVDEAGLVNYAEIIGSELVVNGDFATDLSGWTLSNTNATNTIVWNSGKALMTADGSIALLLRQSAFEIGKTYIIELDAYNITGAGFKLFDGGEYLKIQSDGHYTVYHTALTLNFNLYRYQSGAASSGEFDNISVKEVTRDNVPRIDYTGGGCPHILAEPQRTNLITYSEDFQNSYYDENNGVTATNNSTTSPSGLVNASKILGSLNNAYIGRLQAYTTTSKTVTTSVFLKQDSISDVGLYYTGNLGDGANDNLQIDLNLGTLTSIGSGITASITPYSNGWYKVTSTYTTKASGSTLGIRLYSLSAGSFFAWGWQLEEGSFATSYIPTSGSTVTRNQDQFTRDGISSLINSEEGVLFVEMAALSDDGTPRSISLNSGASSNRVAIQFRAASGQINTAIVVGGAAQSVMPFTISQTAAYIKIALKWKVNDFALWVNGVEVGTDASGSTFTSATLNSLDFNDGGGTEGFYGKVKQLQVYKTALTDEQLLQLTGESGTDFYESYAEMASALTYTIQ